MCLRYERFGLLRAAAQLGIERHVDEEATLLVPAHGGHDLDVGRRKSWCQPSMLSENWSRG
jgi:hypothetical protein